eukprot:1832726-Prymnesium_polylepis.1
MPASARLVAADVGQSCDAACQREGRRCAAEHFEFANQVERLREAFPCENGYATVTGPDIPNYVVEQQNEYAGRCLVSEGGYTCTARHRATRRLCPCDETL